MDKKANIGLAIVAAISGFVFYFWRRSVMVVKITDSIGWPYVLGRGSPSTPWADGPKGVDCSGHAQMALYGSVFWGKRSPIGRLRRFMMTPGVSILDQP